MYDFKGKTALVTGATSGIGREVALKLAADGAHVIVHGRDAGRGDQVVQDIRRAGGSADFAAAELDTVEGAQALAAEATRLGDGKVDILVNNAGIFPFAPTDQVTEQDFDQVMSVNVKGPYFLVAALAPGMAERGGGAVVNLSTMAANFGAAGMSLYSASKAALQHLTRAWAAEFGASAVRFNTVSPGPTVTPGTEPYLENFEAEGALAPSGRVSTAEEVADAIAFLVSDAAVHVHGALLPVDGGRIAV